MLLLCSSYCVLPCCTKVYPSTVLVEAASNNVWALQHASADALYFGQTIALL